MNVLEKNMTTCNQCKTPIPKDQGYFCSEECRAKYWGPSPHHKQPTIWTPERVLEMGRKKIEEKKALAEQYEREWEEEQARIKAEKEEKNRPFQEAAGVFGVELT